MGQVASLCDKVDYDIHNFVAFLSLDFMPLDKVRVYGDLTYTYSKAEADDPHFGNPFSKIEWTYPSSLDGGSTPWFVITYTGDMDDMSDWYDLKMERVDASLGLDWNVWKNLSVTTRFTYRWYDDDEEYLYEDTDGEAYIWNVGVIWKF